MRLTVLASGSGGNSVLIEADRTKVMTELRVEVVNLTLAATEKLLGENMDTDKNRKLVEDFVSKVEVAS